MPRHPSDRRVRAPAHGRSLVASAVAAVVLLLVTLGAAGEHNAPPAAAGATGARTFTAPATPIAARSIVRSTAGGATGVPGIATRGFRVGPPLNAAAAGEPCFGALARDTRRPCSNPRLATDVIPTPALARQEPNAACVPVEQTAILLPCAFGVPEAGARAHFALIGDSHAAQWRGGLAHVARARGWHGTSITRSSCPYSAAVTVLADSGRSARCQHWKDAVTGWLRHHPEVTTVFFSGHSGGAVLAAPRHTAAQTQIAGYRQAWSRLPATVRQIFVIRDTPRNRSTTSDCVVGAMRAHRRPGPACGVARGFAVHLDPEAIAARRTVERAVSVLDLTHYLCSPRTCLPVIGGALVHKDIDHLTQTFAASTGPLLLRAIDSALAASR
jgi:hypothetical protein